VSAGDVVGAMIAAHHADDMWAAPGTAGKPPLGPSVEILDEDARPLPAGRRGRIFVDGRDDDVIVSAGENVFPSEVEDLIASHKVPHSVRFLDALPRDATGKILKRELLG